MPDTIHLGDKALQTFDGDKLPYRKWLPKDEPELVIIGVHGISGAAADYNPLATYLLAKNKRIAVYASETRGQGNDPKKERRGHIKKRQHWFCDLYSFTKLIRKKHPDAKIIWAGESMGSLIVLHSYAAAIQNHPALPDHTALCDAMVISSPIVEIRGDFPRWKIHAAHTLATFFPMARISLESLSGEDEVRVTKNSVHQEQVTKNPYHIKQHTFRLLSTLGDMIETAGNAGQALDLPLLILHGGKDIFSEADAVEQFAKSLPNQDQVTRKYYPESFHLLFYDHERELVMQDIGRWLKTIQE